MKEKMSYGMHENGYEIVIQGNGYFRVQTYNRVYNMLHTFGQVFNTTPNKGYDEFKKLGFECEFEYTYDSLYCKTLEEALRIKEWFDSINVVEKLRGAK